MKNSGIFNIFIGLSNGNIYVYEGSSLEEINFMQPSNGSINRILFADADNDATKEIVCCSSDNTLIYHPISLSLEQTISYGSNDFEIGNVDSDDLNEIVLASGLVLECDGLNTIIEWNYGEDFGYLIELSDIDSDDMEEIIAVSSWYYVNCFEADIQSPKWQINADLDVDGPFYPIDVGDVDSDGQKEIVFASFESNSGYDDGIIFIYDAETHNLEWNSNDNMFGGHAWTGIHDLKIGDVDDDDIQEIVVATDRLYDGAIYIINGIGREMEQSYFYDDGAPIYSIAIADIDNDNETEIIAGGGREHTGAPGVYIYIINGSTGTVEWNSISLGDYWSDFYTLKVGDIDGDGIQEIVGINDRIFVFDGISHQMWNSSFTGCYGLDLSDIDNDSIKEIIVGTRDGRIVAIDGQTYSEEFNIMASTSSISAIRAFDINEDGFTVLDGDCDDTDPNVYSGAPELCDGKDNDCDGIIPADESDQDADGYSVCEGDSNDNDNKIYPGATGKKEKYEKKKDLQLSSYSIYLSILQLQGLLKRHFIGPYYNFQDWSQEYIRLNWLFNYNNIDPVSYLPFYNWNSGFYNDYSFGWQQFSRYPKKLY